MSLYTRITFITTALHDVSKTFTMRDVYNPSSEAVYKDVCNYLGLNLP